MSFLVGQRVRFGAKFKDENASLFDPTEITATITMGGSTSVFTQRDGVRRRSRGDYFVDVVLTSSGSTSVKFASTGSGQEAVQLASYQVSTGEFGAPPVQPPSYAPRADEIAAAARAMLIADIVASGIPCDISRSDAYLSAVLSEHRRQEDDGRRRASHERSREAWRKT